MRQRELMSRSWCGAQTLMPACLLLGLARARQLPGGRQVLLVARRLLAPQSRQRRQLWLAGLAA